MVSILSSYRNPVLRSSNIGRVALLHSSRGAVIPRRMLQKGRRPKPTPRTRFVTRRAVLLQCTTAALTENMVFGINSA